MKIFPISLFLAAVFFLPVAHAAEFLRESVANDYEENLAEMFLHFHRNPELSNLESKTAKRLAAEIRAFGYEVTEGVALSLGVPEDLLPEVIRSPIETTPPTINDAETASRVLSAVSEQMGEAYLYELPREGMGAEDFAYFVQPELGVKGVYFAVGGTPQSELGTQPSHHSPFFKIEPEPSIKSGIEATVIAAMTLFGD